ncbi:MAG TPA: sugar transferase, partial [Anaerolineae bacterium]|nr:sugar transferase [Anaerolineae bacterium]
MRSASLAVKRGFDVLFALTLLVVLSPVLALVALAVRLTSPGPALFRQERLGRGGAPFTCHKFRTMHVNAPDIRNPDGSTYNARDDARVTPVGRFLRRSSLDELPQLINVLKGDMSVVGPRPDIVEALSL